MPGGMRPDDRKIFMDPHRRYGNVASHEVDLPCSHFFVGAAFQPRSSRLKASPTLHWRLDGVTRYNLHYMNSESESNRKPRIDVTRLLREMRLDEALQSLKTARGEFDPAAVAAMVLEYESQASRLHAAGEMGEAKRMTRRAAALTGLLTHGPDPARMVAEVDLAEGYRGRILLVLLTGGVFSGMVCLRSGDDLHREILRNTQAEIGDLGFARTRVHPLGGAFAGFESDGSIVIWGTSDEFGCCDKEVAARLIARAYPGKLVRIEE